MTFPSSSYMQMLSFLNSHILSPCCLHVYTKLVEGLIPKAAFIFLQKQTPRTNTFKTNWGRLIKAWKPTLSGKQQGKIIEKEFLFNMRLLPKSINNKNNKKLHKNNLQCSLGCPPVKYQRHIFPTCEKKTKLTFKCYLWRYFCNTDQTRTSHTNIYLNRFVKKAHSKESHLTWEMRLPGLMHI